MNCNLTDKEREAGILCRSFDCIPCRRYNNNTLTHLMSRIGPFSFCNVRLRDNSGMRQTFKLSEVTCLECKGYAEIEFYDYIKQLEEKQKELDGAISFILKASCISNNKNFLVHLDDDNYQDIKRWFNEAREFLKKCEENK